MFTGIIESIGYVKNIQVKGSNKDYTIESDITGELQIDQSVSHNGVCLTVVSINGSDYVVSAIDETLQKSNLKTLSIGDKVNLERSVTLERRLDGHMVQGHVDTTAVCRQKITKEGSWVFTFEVDESYGNLMVEKGSICINGTSLTIFDVNGGLFSVAIIPYTYEHTNFHELAEELSVNIEFDIMGKYILKYLKNLNLSL